MPSSKKPSKKTNRAFVRRFIEICGSNKPREIENLLGISYQTVLNYLKGRLPEATILINIAKKTGCSLDWLLMGKGRKYIDENFQDDSQRLSANITNNFPPKLIKKLNFVFEDYESEKEHTHTAPPIIVKLKPDKIRHEKEKDRESKDLPVKEDEL